MINAKLGIIIPIYNAEKYIGQCVESILRQTYSQFELVMVDDGSTDSSGQICDEYAKKDSRVHVIHQPNKGKLSARFAGVENACCEYVSFVDADDWIDMHTYEYLQKYMEEEIDIISYSIIRWVDEDYQRISIEKDASGFLDKDDLAELHRVMIWNIKENRFGIDPSLCNKVFKRTLIKDELERAVKINVLYGDDVAVTYPAIKNAHNMMITDYPLYYHRQRRRNEIPYYFSDDNYFIKLTSLYDYLAKRFDHDKEILKQLDYFFATSAKYRLLNYGYSIVSEKYKYMFPFNRVEKGSDIVIYGASEVGREYEEQVRRTKYANIVLWVDREYEYYRELGVVSPESLKDVQRFDYLIVAIANKKVALEIENRLINMGVDKQIIISL